MISDRVRISGAVAVATLLAAIWFLRDIEPAPWSDVEIALIQSLRLENLAELPRDPTNAVADDERAELESWSPDCLISVAALGFGDVPAKAFVEAFNMISEEGWVAFNIKETFFDRRIDWGFSQFIRELIFSEYLDLYQLRRYRHRLSIEGEPLYYFALGGKKRADVPPSFIDSLDLSAK